MAGAQLSLGYLSMFTEGMTAGRGFIALVAVMFARGSAFRVLLVTMLFAHGNAVELFAPLPVLFVSDINDTVYLRYRIDDHPAYI